MKKRYVALGLAVGVVATIAKRVTERNERVLNKRWKRVATVTVPYTEYMKEDIDFVKYDASLAELYASNKWLCYAALCALENLNKEDIKDWRVEYDVTEYAVCELVNLENSNIKYEVYLDLVDAAVDISIYVKGVSA